MSEEETRSEGVSHLSKAAQPGRADKSPNLQSQGPRPGKGRESLGSLQGGFGGQGVGEMRPKPELSRTLREKVIEAGREAGRNGANIPAASTGNGSAGLPCPLQSPWDRVTKPTRTTDPPPTPSQSLPPGQWVLQGPATSPSGPMVPSWSVPLQKGQLSSSRNQSCQSAAEIQRTSSQGTGV